MSAASPVAYAAQPGTTGGAYPGVKYGGFWLRLVAYFLDGLIIGIPTMIVIVVIFLGLGGVAYVRSHFPANMDPDQINANVSNFIGAIFGFYALMILAVIVISWLYYALMESSERQATLGKMALSLKVTDMAGNRMSFGRASGRFFAKTRERNDPIRDWIHPCRIHGKKAGAARFHRGDTRCSHGVNYKQHTHVAARLKLR